MFAEVCGDWSHQFVGVKVWFDGPAQGASRLHWKTSDVFQGEGAEGHSVARESCKWMKSITKLAFGSYQKIILLISKILLIESNYGVGVGEKKDHLQVLESLAFIRSQPKMSCVLASSWQRPASFTPGCVHHKLPVANRQPVNKPHYWSPFSLIYGCCCYCAVHYSSRPHLTSVKWNITLDTRSSV